METVFCLENIRKKFKDFELHLMKKFDFPVVKNECPANGETKRQYVKDLLRNISKENKGVRESVFGAIMRSEEWRK